MSFTLDSLPTVSFFDHKELGSCVRIRFDFSNGGFATLDMIAATAREFADRIYTIADAIDIPEETSKKE